jgi:hypothetical protein
MNRVCLILILLLWFAACKSQSNAVKYYSEKEYFNDGSSGAGFDFLRSLANDSVSDYKKKYKISVPESFKGKKIARNILQE